MSNGLSYIHNPRQRPFLYTTMGELVKKWANKHPCKLALVVNTFQGRETLTFGELDRKSDNFASFLSQFGIKPGDRMAVFMCNSPSWLIANVGLAKLGATAINSYSYEKDDSYRWILDANCSGLVIDMNDNNLATIAKVEDIQSCTSIEGKQFLVIYTSGSEELNKSSIPFTTAVNFEPENITFPRVDPDSLCYVFNSSGSTGKPKCIVHTHRSLINNGDAIADVMQLTSEDVFWGPRPLGYGAGFPIVMFVRGTTFVTVDTKLGLSKNFNEKSINIIKEEGVTAGYIAPYFVYDLDDIKSKLGVVPKLKTAITSGQRITSSSARKLFTFSERAVQAYGCVEAMWCTSEVITDPAEAEDDVLGYPIPGVELKIVDDSGTIVDIGQCGEILIRSPYLFHCYIQQDGRIESGKSESGWLSTGDIGCLMPNGRGYVRGRKVEVIKKFAYKIFPSSVEIKMKKIPDIQEVCVVGVSEPRMYENIVAFVSLVKGSHLTEASLWKICEEIFQPDIKDHTVELMPGHVFIIETIPKLSSGKVDRMSVKKMAQEFVDRKGSFN